MSKVAKGLYGHGGYTDMTRVIFAQLGNYLGDNEYYLDKLYPLRWWQNPIMWLLGRRWYVINADREMYTWDEDTRYYTNKQAALLHLKECYDT